MKAIINNVIISSEVKIAKSFIERLVGLMFKKEMKGFDALLIKRCNSIHTFFMCYPIDVLFLDSEMNIVRIYRSLFPWRLTRIVWKSVQVLELKAGTLPEKIKIGDRLELCTS